ncbi:MAG: hypothetical protein E2604_12670 [Flavobacterium sp.]|nr:hypothetical protein [Flavobacterium sp.]
MKINLVIVVGVIFFSALSCTNNIKKEYSHKIILDSIAVEKQTSDLKISSENDRIRYFFKVTKAKLPDTLILCVNEKKINICCNQLLKDRIKTKWIYDYSIPDAKNYNLKTILKEYNSFVDFNQDSLQIISNVDFRMYKMDKSKYFSVKYFLNQNLVSKSDSICLNKSVSFPKPKS